MKKVRSKKIKKHGIKVYSRFPDDSENKIQLLIDAVQSLNTDEFNRFHNVYEGIYLQVKIEEELFTKRLDAYIETCEL